MTDANKPAFQSTRLERVFYGVYFLGQNILFFLILTFLFPFFTDVGISAAVVGTIALAVRIFDAVNDPVFGSIVDRSHLKSGKFLPWLRLSLVGIPLFSVLLFLIPESGPLAPSLKIAWAATAYTLWSVSYTICDVPIFGIITALTGDSKERTTLISIGRLAAGIGAIVTMAVLPTVRQAIGGWFPTVLVLSVAAFIFMAPICFIAKERVPPPESKEKMSVKTMFTFIGKNKYLQIFYLGMILAYGGNIAGTLGMYLSRINLGNEALMAPLSLMGYVPGIAFGIVIPILNKKIDKYHMLMTFLFASLIIGVAAYFVGYQNLALFWTFALLRGAAFGGIFIFMFMFTPDFAEYGMFKTGISAFGVSFSLQTFTAKFVGAIGGWITGIALTVIGFVAGEGAVQSADFPGKLWFAYCMVPNFFVAASIPLFLTYKLRDRHVAAMIQANRGEIAHEEAERLIGAKL